MITLKRKSGVSLQAGVDSYVFLFWKEHRNCQAIVSIETSYNGELWSNFNAIAFPLIESDASVRVGWLNDILDGEDYVRILGIQDIQSIDVYGGLPEDV